MDYSRLIEIGARLLVTATFLSKIVGDSLIKFFALYSYYFEFTTVYALIDFIDLSDKIKVVVVTADQVAKTNTWVNVI